MKYNNIDELLNRISYLESENEYMQERFMKIEEMEKKAVDMVDNLEVFLKRWQFEYNITEKCYHQIITVYGKRFKKNITKLKGEKDENL